MKAFESQKAEEFSKVENVKTKYNKYVELDNNYTYELKLPNGVVVKDVNSDLALYLHSLESRLKLR